MLTTNSIVYLYKPLYFCLPRLKFLKSIDGKGCRCLDFGCGERLVLRQNLAVRPELTYFGIDVKNFPQKLPPYIPFTLYDGIKMPFRSNSFDVVTMNHVSEHIKKPEETLTELKRVVKKAAYIFIEVPNERSLWGKPGGRFGGTVHFQDDPTHLKPYSTNELAAPCKKVGLKVIASGVSRHFLHLFFLLHCLF